MWRDTMVVDYRARIEKLLSFKTDTYEVEFVGTKTTFRGTVPKLRELLYDWLWHIWIKQSTAHWHKFKIETFDVDTVIIVWDYANCNPMIGPKKATCESDPKLAYLVAMSLFNPTVRTDAESDAAGKPREVMCDYWRSFSPAKDCAD